jgi:hypothetical protein
VFKRISSHIGIGGFVEGRFQIRSNTREQRAAHFNKIKSAYYNALLGVAALDSKNIQLRALAKWGADTKVETGFGNGFGEALISYQEFEALGIK